MTGELPIRAVPWAALDIEMTGLRAGQDRIIEVAVARGIAGGVPEVWSALIDPGQRVRTVGIHGITAEMLAGKPAFREIVPELERRLEGAVLIAHHARIDLAFLQREYRRCGRLLPSPPVIDTLGLARGLPGLSSRALPALCAHLRVPHADAHRAAGDALATWHLCGALLDALDPGRALTVDGAVALGQRSRPVDRAGLPDRLRDLIGGPPVWIEYRAAEGEVTRRAIRIRALSSRRVEAWCLLRGAERVFRVDRVRLLSPEEIAQEEIAQEEILPDDPDPATADPAADLDGQPQAG